MATSASKTTGLVTSHDDRSELPLSAAEHKLLAQALQRADEARETIESAVVTFGRWALVNVFADDARAALEARHENPVWQALRARAGGPTLRLSERLLTVALLIAARDKRITDEAWRSLDAGRKELLLPLGDERAMRKAAQHVTRMKMTQRATRAYVGALRAEAGQTPAQRLTPARLVGRARKVRAALTEAGLQRRSVAMVAKMGDAQRAALKEEVDALAAWVAAMKGALGA